MTWDVARINPATNDVTSYPVAGAFGVTWGGDALSVAAPGRRGDSIARLEIDR